MADHIPQQKHILLGISISAANHKLHFSYYTERIPTNIPTLLNSTASLNMAYPNQAYQKIFRSSRALLIKPKNSQEFHDVVLNINTSISLNQAYK